jgi:muconolactone D-isomerase
MEFLVEIEIRLPPELDDERRADLLARERDRGSELRSEGAIRRIWRIPGRHANVGVWEAPDATALHDKLSSLPLFPYADIRVTPLARHYLEDGAPDAGVTRRRR